MAPASDHFQRPVVIQTYFGIPTAVSTAMEAYMFLTDWPPTRRDPAHGFALKACLAAVRGEIEPETARGLFASWAERNDILATDFAAFVASQKKRSHGSV